jgi:hypothetical protein
MNQLQHLRILSKSLSRNLTSIARNHRNVLGISSRSTATLGGMAGLFDEISGRYLHYIEGFILYYSCRIFR